MMEDTDFNTDEILQEINVVLKNNIGKLVNEKYKLYETTHKSVMHLTSTLREHMRDELHDKTNTQKDVIKNEDTKNLNNKITELDDKIDLSNTNYELLNKTVTSLVDIISKLNIEQL